MLTVSLKVDEYAMITLPDGTTHKVYVTQIRRKQVRLRFEVPRECSIVRSKLLEAQADEPDA